MKLSLVIPVYGSAAILAEAHAQFSAAARTVTEAYELVFCYDGSPDDSWAVLTRLAAQDPAHVRVLTHAGNRGLGYTLRQLFDQAQGEYVLYFDADAYRCFDLTVLPNFLEMIRQYDVIVASRYERRQQNIPWVRVYASRLYYRLGRVLFGVGVADVGSGFVLLRRTALARVRLAADGFAIHIELFARLQGAGCRIKEVDVEYRHWFGGSFGVFRHGWATLRGTLRVWWALRREDRAK